MSKTPSFETIKLLSVCFINDPFWDGFASKCRVNFMSTTVNLIILFGGVILGCLVLMLIGTFLIKIRTGRLAKKREGETFNDFAAQFQDSDIPVDVLKNSYDYFGKWNSVSSRIFPVRRSDNIADVYGIVDEDLDDAIEEILTMSGHIPSMREGMLERFQIETVGDLVFHIASAPKVSSSM